MTLSHSKSAACHSASSVDIHAQTSVRRIVFLLCPSLSARVDRPFSRIRLHMEFPPSSHPCCPRTVQTEGRICVRHSRHPHRMQERYERYRYHLTSLHNHHRSHKNLFYSAYLPLLLHRQTVAHILFSLNLSP